MVIRARRLLSIEPCTPYQLLIADDDPGFREALRAILEPFFRLVEVDSGEEALAAVSDHRYDLALLDMHMHVLTGLETLRELKSLNADAPCILVTADATDALCREAKAADAFTVLSKPVTRRLLVLTVSHALEDAYRDPEALAGLSL